MALETVMVSAGRSANPLNDFLSSFTNDVARPNRFLARINVPQPLIPLKKQTGGILSLRCENAQLPGRTFGTVDQKFGSNPTQKHPIHTSYNDLELTFIVSGDMSEKTFFDIWMEYINPTGSFDFGYKLDNSGGGTGYASTITVTQYNVNNEPSYVVNIFNAYPIAVNQLDLDWSSDGYHKLTVVFAYDYWQNGGVSVLQGSGILPSSENVNVNAMIGNQLQQATGSAPTITGTIVDAVSGGVSSVASVATTAVNAVSNFLPSNNNNTSSGNFADTIGGP